MPDPEQFAAMGRYNDELQRAGVLLELNGLAPTTRGARAVLPASPEQIAAKKALEQRKP